MPVIQARPETIGTMAGRPPTVAPRAMRQTNSDPMMDRGAIDVALRQQPARA
jgi:hypothetical protein